MYVQAWRFLTYQFVHLNTEHIAFNTLVQLVVGLPLEMSQPGLEGTLRSAHQLKGTVSATLRSAHQLKGTVSAKSQVSSST